MALATEIIDFHTLVWFWFVQPGERDQENGRGGKWYRTTGGRVLFNSIIPDEMGFLNKTFGKKELGDLVFDCFTEVGLSRTTEFLDNLKDFGFRYATMGGVSVGVEDLELVTLHEENAAVPPPLTLAQNHGGRAPLDVELDIAESSS